MTGICPTCGHATEVQHIGRTRIPVEFCARCNVTLGQLDDGQAQVMRLRAADTGSHADDEYTHESLANARFALAESRSLTPAPGSGTVSNRERPVTFDTTTDTPPPATAWTQPPAGDPTDGS